MRKRFRKMTAVMLTLFIIALIVSNGAISLSAAELQSDQVGLESTGNSTFDAFINDKRWTAGVPWWGDYTGGKGPEISSWDSSGCGAYAGDFAKYCFNVDNPRYGGEAFSNVNEVRAGDVIHIGYNDNGHWFVILKRSGNSLYTAEGNYGGVVRIGWNYSISGTKFAEDSRHFDVGYHFQDEDLGTDFYALITHMASWNHLTNESDGNVDICWENYTANQYWKFYRQSDGSYIIKNAKTGKCLDLSGGSSQNGANIQVWDQNSSDAQKWELIPCGNGYQIKARCTDCVMEMNAWSFYQGVNCVSGSRDGSDAEIFAINKERF